MDDSLNALWMELFLFYKNPLDHKNSNLAMSRRDREAITKGAFGKEGCVFNPRQGGQEAQHGRQVQDRAAAAGRLAKVEVGLFVQDDLRLEKHKLDSKPH